MKIPLLSLTFFLVACSTTPKNELADRTPAQSIDNYFKVVGSGKESRKELNFTTWVQVRAPEIPPEELREVKRTCRARMVLKLLQFSQNLKALHHQNMDLRISDTIHTYTSGGKYFNFSLVGTDENKYSGYMYIDETQDENKIISRDQESNIYYCYQSYDNWRDFAQLKDQNKTLVFSSSYATKNLNGSRVDERGVPIPKKKK